MAYTKTTWVNNQAPAINADNLNKIEDGIYNSVRYADAQSLTDAQKQQARTNINAAPGGFGLGTISQTVTDFDTVKLNGWYYGAAGTAHAPDSENSWSVRVTNIANNSEVCIQDAYTLFNIDRYLHCRRLVYVSTATQNNPWEWVDPPMYFGVEYRTTERYHSKPVYVKAVSVSSFPLGGFENRIQVNTDIPSVDVDTVVRWGGFGSDGGNDIIGLPATFGNDNKITISGYLYKHESLVAYIQSSGTDFSAYSGTLWLAYTKTTN